jgi:signal transduction histidine kinase
MPYSLLRTYDQEKSVFRLFLVFMVTSVFVLTLSNLIFFIPYLEKTGLISDNFIKSALFSHFLIHIIAGSCFAAFLMFGFGYKILVRPYVGLQRMEAALSKTIEAVVHLDKDRKILSANQSFLSLFLIHEQGFVGQRFYDFFESYAHELLDQGFHTAQEFGYAEMLLSHSNHRSLQLSFVPDYQKDKIISGYFCFIKDVTEQRQSENTIEAAVNQLVETNTNLERFCYMASHDLQEPLRMITIYTQQLKEKYADRLDDKGGNYLNFAHDGALRMQQLVADLLRFVQLDKEPMILEEVSCESALEFVLADIRNIIKKSNAIVDFDPLPIIIYNKIHFVQILQNLIINSIKYKRDDRDPMIFISCQEDIKSYIFKVVDNGIGVQSEYLDQIFIPFRRLHGGYEYSGTGIGLAICKKLVENAGGRIWLESRFGQGTSFFFTIPKIMSGV